MYILIDTLTHGRWTRVVLECLTGKRPRPCSLFRGIVEPTTPCDILRSTMRAVYNDYTDTHPGRYIAPTNRNDLPLCEFIYLLICSLLIFHAMCF